MTSGASDAVSVVMIVRNGERFIRGAVTSVRSQTHPAQEIFAVDGSSEDATREILAELHVRTGHRDPRGIGDARNFGVAQTTSGWVAFLDHDDRWEPAKLERQLQQVREEDTRCGVTMLIASRDPGTSVHPTLQPMLDREPVVGWTPSTLMIARSLLEELGGFDEHMGIGADMDFFARLIDSGVGVSITKSPLVQKLMHDRNASIDASAAVSDMFKVVRTSIERKRGSGPSAEH